jgi:hypothetical protein
MFHNKPGSGTPLKDMNKQEYEAAIDATALRTDLDMLSGGDQTEIGEKVICIYNLTGL